MDDKGIQQRTGSSKTFQEEVAAMQDIEFQMQRSECTKVRQEATRLFPTAPTRAVEILRGGRSKVIREHAYDGLPGYGAYAHLSADEVLGHVDGMLAAGTLRSTGGRFPKLARA